MATVAAAVAAAPVDDGSTSMDVPLISTLSSPSSTSSLSSLLLSWFPSTAGSAAAPPAWTKVAGRGATPTGSKAAAPAATAEAATLMTSARNGLTPIRPPSSGGGLERSLGLADLILLGIGASIGSGIFVVTGVAARQTGPAVVLSFAIAGLASVLDALCYAELGSRFAGRVGGAYLYTHETFGELPAFILFCHLMFDYHIGAASIARSLASYLALLLQPVLPFALPAWLSPGGMELWNSFFSLNLLAPIVLAGITWLLCQGVRESSSVNGVLTSVKVIIVLLVVAVGSTKVDPANWVPFAPFGAGSVVQAASLVFFSYIGFDAVANSAEESKRPARDVPLGILISLSVCVVLYATVCLVLTGMVPYTSLEPAAPLSSAFASLGLHVFRHVIDAGAVVGLTTTLVAGLYVQSRLYLALSRDTLLPSWLACVDSTHHTPVAAQVWVGFVAMVMAGLFDVSRLSQLLSVGVLLSYSLVCLCVPMLRAADAAGLASRQLAALQTPPLSSSPSSAAAAAAVTLASTTAAAPPAASALAALPAGVSESAAMPSSSPTDMVMRTRGTETPSIINSFGKQQLFVLSLLLLPPLLSFLLGLSGRFLSSTESQAAVAVAAAAAGMLLFSLLIIFFRLPSSLFPSPLEGSFKCPWVPWLPLTGITVNTYLIAQMHLAAWVRLVVVTVLAVAVYWVYRGARLGGDGETRPGRVEPLLPERTERWEENAALLADGEGLR